MLGRISQALGFLIVFSGTRHGSLFRKYLNPDLKSQGNSILLWHFSQLLPLFLAHHEIQLSDAPDPCWDT